MDNNNDDIQLLQIITMQSQTFMQVSLNVSNFLVKSS